MFDFPAGILLVAGPSGAGKSTFIRCIKAGSLPPEVRELLPESAAQWRVVEANDFLKRNVAVDAGLHDAGSEPGLILHFDTAFGSHFGVTDYTHDPAFVLMRRTGRLSVVSIQPSPDTLRHQFEARLQEQRRRRGWARELWRRAIHTPMRGLVRRLEGKPAVNASRLYHSRENLERCYREWLTFVRTLLRENPDSRLICVEPRGGQGEKATFVVIPALDADGRPDGAA